VCSVSQHCYDSDGEGVDGVARSSSDDAVGPSGAAGAADAGEGGEGGGPRKSAGSAGGSSLADKETLFMQVGCVLVGVEEGSWTKAGCNRAEQSVQRQQCVVHVATGVLGNEQPNLWCGPTCSATSAGTGHLLHDVMNPLN
jgi:hypothetical protein